MDLQEAFGEIADMMKKRKIVRYAPYPFQREFHEAGQSAIERILIAGNRVGKTMAAASEVAMHATGNYPDWWEGKRFSKPILAWCCGITNETTRDIVQNELFGGVGEDMGTGAVPGDSIERTKLRQAGVGDVIDYVNVRHKSGGKSRIQLKSYDQGWKKFQGTAPEVIWMDEEPDDFKIYTESRTRILTSKGIIMVTFTPLMGETELVLHFMNNSSNRVYMRTATWDDAPHLGEKDKAEILESYPDYEREARSKGIPMMGEGRIFTISEDLIKVKDRNIPKHWARIKGVDFGISHPAAVADIAWDRDKDVIYVTRVWRKSGADVAEHAQAINQDTAWMPVSWPHDGEQRKHSATGNKPLKDIYMQDFGCKFLGMTARYDNKKGGGQDPEIIIMEMQKRFSEGSLKVFSSCEPFFDEYRSYHRKNGKVVALRDDILKAVMYAIMMRRYALPERAVVGQARPRSSYTQAII